MDGVPVTSTASAPVNNFWSTNNFFVSGKGNTLVVTQALTLQYAKTNLLATDASGNVTNAVYGTGIAWDPTTRTLSATATSGDTTGTNLVVLTQSGTNLTSQMDFSLVQNGGAFKLVLTNSVYFSSPLNVVTTSFKKCFLITYQPSTGTCLVQFTNGVAGFAWPQGVSPVVDTNGGATAIIEFVTDLVTNGLVHGSITPLSKTATNL